MNYSLFDVLRIIDFESENIDWDDLPGHLQPFQSRAFVYNSLLFKCWHKLYRISPNWYTVDRLLSKYLGSHVDIGNLTIFGCNAMMWAFQLKTKHGYWLFRPPSFNIFKHNFTWGLLYFSPNGTPHHASAKVFYDFGNC